MQLLVKKILTWLVLVVTVTGCQSTAESATPVPAGYPAKVVEQEAVDGRTDKLVIDSPATGGRRSVWVLKPAAWKPGSTGWRALYLLHGCCAGGGWDWLRTGEVARLTSRLNAVVIVPEGGSMGWYADWRDGLAWETFHMTEVPRLVEPRYGVGTRRAVAGFSMGGLGAFGYAARHPGVFEAAASFSGVLDTREDVPGYRAFMADNGVDTEDLWGDPGAWPEHNPADLVGRLKGVRLYASSGDGEPGPLDRGDGAIDRTEAAIMRQNRNFARAAEKAGVKVTTDFYGKGTHTWPYWIRSFERALPLLLP
ncbi:esterase family protein [Microbispora cellulosiformans]|uniref:Esterase family protein n=1 Tax=Microbispora cellulosiformans TaxID=2614688 RepID=A0A5J5K9D5_9ACTN|nr:alpha/beta hydrolase family protein [Microbispora cellulosiformans]KAA9380453.1 esterase family protein [Microbispora cellulosiformans]